ncbi:MAG: hypothetical protein ACI30K_00920 [Muribaculaceae bacterium]
MECSNKIVNRNGGLSVTLDVYVFMDGGAYIAYSPALDLSGYGESEEAAKESFAIVMDEYIAYGISRKTLIKDLRAHGWKVKSLKQRKMSAPPFDMLLHNNDVFRDILENKEYRKVAEPFPVIA